MMDIGLQVGSTVIIDLLRIKQVLCGVKEEIQVKMSYKFLFY